MDDDGLASGRPIEEDEPEWVRQLQQAQRDLGLDDDTVIAYIEQHAPPEADRRTWMQIEITSHHDDKPARFAAAVKAWAGSSGPTEKTEMPSWLTVWADAVGASSTLTTAVVIEYAKAVDERHVKSSAAMLGFIGSQLEAVVASGHADNIIDAIPQFVDAIETWANVDPETGEIVSGEEEYTDEDGGTDDLPF